MSAKRKWLERFCSLLFLPVLLVPMLFLLVFRLAPSSSEARSKAIRLWFQRWKHYLLYGWAPLRGAWPDSLIYEAFPVIARYWFFLEWFDFLNLLQGRHDKTIEDEPESLVVFRMGHPGDVLHVVPMLKAVSQSRKFRRIKVVAGGWSKAVHSQLEPYAQIMPYRTNLAGCNRAGSKAWTFFYEWSVMFTLRRERFACSVSTSHPMIVEMALLLACAPVHHVGGYLKQEWFLLPGTLDIEQPRVDKYEAERLVGLLKYFGVQGEYEPLFFECSPNDVRSVEVLKKKLPDDKNATVVVAPGAGWPGKEWPPECYAEVIRRLVEELDCCVLLTGSPDEQELLASVQEQSKVDCVNLCNQLTFSQLAALVAQVDLVICNDSAPLHLAVAGKTPVVALFGPTPPAQWVPKMPTCRVLQGEISCEGCVPWHPNAACLESNRCMRTTSVQDVFQAAAEIIGSEKK